MYKPLFALATLAAIAMPGAAIATLPVGAAAPAFSTQGALGGKDVPLDLRRALRKGAVVLYFYPKAFTQGCTLEAHAFAEATPEFAKYGATVIGLSADDLPTLRKFSTEACRDKFTVGVASPAIIKSYDVALKRAGVSATMTDRTSYVIAPSGKIVFVHSDMNYRDHVAQTLAAVKALKKR
ncbi:peroxiredoxin [Novosphingobium chloroacetimidivorans]|uniref:thioredoxin-dependent peroxiredoxin n=1 Tax=Novosphingobium chloroacetimidivorans TaxID=1428314 RepID=A0A7W7NVB6_9SPHN|nr:peroxiredoxin [Novosphingobium chloroacetimidivorans]MBB4857119.1 peroxiredoxin [Novosphingobium chloroacetimidivorans]